jgi:hypothetical protein
VRALPEIAVHECGWGGTVGGLQSPAYCVLAQEDVRALPEIAVHECGWGGVVCCWNRPEAGHVLAELCDEERWVSSRSQ